MRFAGSDCYSSATVDVVEKRALLSLDTDTGPQLWVADLTDEPPQPREFLNLPGNRAPTDLYFEASRRRLLSVHAESGELWEIDLSADQPRLILFDYDLGWPMALAYAPTDQRLFVTDGKEGKIWALDCKDRCREPTVFLRSDALKNPTSLAVARDGTLWLGDLQNQTLMTISPDGSVESTIRSLSAARVSPTTPAARPQ
jgi:hypothetical protein